MTLIESLEAEFELQENSFTSKMPINEYYGQPQGYVAGGIYLLVAETAAGYASNLMGQKAENKYYALGQNITAHHIRPKKSDTGFILATGTLLHQGRSSHLWEVKITDENDKLISIISVQNFILPAQ